MYKTSCLIISNRKELSIKYKKLIEALGQNAYYTDDLSKSLSIIQKDSVEFIIISDTIKENLGDFIEKIRVLTYNNRPVIIAVSKSNDLDDKIKALDKGADDFLGEEISKKEFQMRYRAHLRRFLESSINPSTNFLNKNVTIKAIKKALLEDDNSYLLIKIKEIELYQKIYGEIAYEKVLQTLGAIINSTLSQEDFMGQIGDNSFILITKTYKAEKLANFLTFGFDNILNKFYSKAEYDDNFTIETSETSYEMKKELMRLNIAIATNMGVKDYRQILNILQDTIKLCTGKNSSVAIDRFKLKGEINSFNKVKEVLILEPDISLAYLLKNVCELEGIKTITVQNKEEFYQNYEKYRPDVVLLDWGNDMVSQNLEIAKNISKDDVKLIFSSSYLNKKEILKAGADLYVPKPYEVNDIVYWIKKFLDT